MHRFDQMLPHLEIINEIKWVDVARKVGDPEFTWSDKRSDNKIVIIYCIGPKMY